MRKGTEALNYKWKPQAIRLLWAASLDAGPVDLDIWSRRTGIPRNHLLNTVREVERLGGIATEILAEGLKVAVLPVKFWRVTEISNVADWRRAWVIGSRQERLDIASEMPDLADALASVGSESEPPPESGVLRNSETLSDTDLEKMMGSSDPESGVRCTGLTFNASAFTAQTDQALNVKRLTEPPESGDGHRAGWFEPETESEAMAACHRLLGGDKEMKAWGGRWRLRWREDSGKLKRVLNAIREEQSNRRRPNKTWGAFADDLWRRFAPSDRPGSRGTNPSPKPAVRSDA